MATNTRIYVVRGREGEPVHLVDAANGAQAIGHVVRNAYTAEVASQSTLVELVTSGVKVEKARATE